ncbi:ankyrin repeat and MYND domain-containing protein 1-like [Battus philenor]|uniref:ankyrin repeat and MYND domain-containing protein 1-like n=1 Tax=Battus philenor TaxID=42288 RepID=UPI0035D05E60
MSEHFCGTVKEKSWPYEQYYIGDKDTENRRNADGENHWTGAKSLEKYSGRFVRDMMHGVGEYYWRYLDREGEFRTYEGSFYCNQIHGYGCMSYSDGRVFNGLFYSNIRCGPGVETFVDVRQDVGLWLDNQLLRLAWMPPTYSLILDLMTTNAGRNCVDKQRTLMTVYTKTHSKNPAVDLLDQYGSDPQMTAKNWIKLYSRHCTDITSPAFQLQLFEEIYSGSDKINVLMEKDKISENSEENKTYFAWNNNEIIKHMMKHAYVHENQRISTGLNISHIISDSRKKLKAPAKHELDSRTLLMASYMGHKATVVHLINEENVHPDVTDIQGNSVLMYAVCGDHTDIIHFLVEAGAGINNYNDSCCTALSIALMRYICARKEITISEMTQALIPETSLTRTSSLENVFEWFMGRDALSPIKPSSLTRNTSKIIKHQTSLKIKSLTSLKLQMPKGNATSFTEKVQDQSYVSGNEEINNSIDLYSDTLGEYSANVSELYSAPNAGNPITYVFEVNDITNELIDIEIEEQKKMTEKNPKKGAPEAPKPEPLKLPADVLIARQATEEINLSDNGGPDTCEIMTLTIIQLLSDGADPNLIRCPQPALFLAVSSGCCNIVKQLIDYGANPNEFYPHVLGYSPLDIAISYPFSVENLDVIRVLLENGADAQHRLPHNPRNSTELIQPGPTLLHAVLAKAARSEIDEEIRQKLLNLLLTYKCSPIEQFSGRSALDISMTKGVDVFNVFIAHPRVDLNVAINQSNQTILTKMFTITFFKTFESIQRQEILKNLLIHGADPFRPCQNEEEIFDNLFLFAKKNLEGYDATEANKSQSGSKNENKGKKNGKASDDKASKQKTIANDIEEYKQMSQFVTDWARLSHIRWLRAKLVMDLIITINKYKHRHWNMILKEVNNIKQISLWLTPIVCLEVWTNINTPNKKKLYDKTVLKHLLSIVSYCCQCLSESFIITKVSANDRNLVEQGIKRLLRKYYSDDLSTEINYFTTSELDKDAT